LPNIYEYYTNADGVTKNKILGSIFVNKFVIENGEYLIAEDCRELRRQVQLTEEEKIEEINKHCDALILKIDAYEERCKSKYKEMNKQKFTISAKRTTS
jgi:hypothetical protein